jgi:hypothetical protein
MLKYGEVNPLSVFELRRINHCPPHFISVVFDIRTSEKDIIDWVYTNLSGRFCFDSYYDELQRLEHNSVVLKTRLSFEIPSEASYFALMLDTINTSPYDF